MTRSLATLATKEVKKTGFFTLPGLCCINTRTKPATKAGVRTVFGKESNFKAKPAGLCESIPSVCSFLLLQFNTGRRLGQQVPLQLYRSCLKGLAAPHHLFLGSSSISSGVVSFLVFSRLAACRCQQHASCCILDCFGAFLCSPG